MSKDLSQSFLREVLRCLSNLNVLRETLDNLEPIELGSTPRELVFKNQGMALFRYECQKTRPIPVLLVYSLVNRPEIADLQSDRSLIKELIDAGYVVYLIEWGNPNDIHIELNLETYILEYLNSAVDYIARSLSGTSVHLVGLCQGGTFAVCYSSLYPEKVASLTTTVTPVDFQTESDSLSNLIKYVDFDLIEKLPKVVDGAALNLLFLFLKPYSLLQLKYLILLQKARDKDFVENFFRMEKWIFDSPPISARTCIEFAELFYKRNSLFNGTLSLGGRLVNPRNISAPVLNIFGKDDHLVPPESSRALSELLSHSNYTEVEMKCGHVGVYVGKSSGISTGQIIGKWIEKTEN